MFPLQDTLASPVVVDGRENEVLLLCFVHEAEHILFTYRWIASFVSPLLSLSSFLLSSLFSCYFMGVVYIHQVTSVANIFSLFSAPYFTLFGAPLGE